MKNKEKACLALILFCASKRRVNRKRWMKEWLKKRQSYTHINLLNEIIVTNEDDYKNYFRMSGNTFNMLLGLVRPYMTRQNTHLRSCISVEERLAVTLRYLATGRYFEDLKFSAIMSPYSISCAVMETCEVIICVLQNYMKFPRTSEEWSEISNKFGQKHQFYNCLGAIDGKHIAIRKPENTGSAYYNYKGFYSIVLLAVVDANKQFVMVDAGINGRISDGGVMFYSKFGELFEQNRLNLPEPNCLPNTNVRFPFVFVADEAFALHQNLLKPYTLKLPLTREQLEYNRRVSRARVVVENAFGILASRFGVFQKAICLEPKKAATIVIASCYLHNFLSTHNNQTYSSLEDSSTSEPLVSLRGNTHRNSSQMAKNTRNMFCDYFNNDGKL